VVYALFPPGCFLAFKRVRHGDHKMQQNLRAQIEEDLRQKVREVRSQYCRGECGVDDLARALKRFTDFIIYEILPPNKSRSASRGARQRSQPQH
jgi:hypothetical protein